MNKEFLDQYKQYIERAEKLYDLRDAAGLVEDKYGYAQAFGLTDQGVDIYYASQEYDMMSNKIIDTVPWDQVESQEAYEAAVAMLKVLAEKKKKDDAEERINSERRQYERLKAKFG